MIALALLLVSCASLQSSSDSEQAKSDNDQTETKTITGQITLAPVTNTSEGDATEKGERPKTKGERLTDCLWRWLEPQNFASLLLFIVGVGAFSVGLGTLYAIKGEVAETANAATAARKSADIAERSLRLLNQPWLDTADWTVSEQRGAAGPDGDGGFTQPLRCLTVAFNVVNNSQTPATLHEIEVTDEGSGSPPTGWTATSGVGNLLTPGSKYPFEVPLMVEDMTERQIADYETERGFVVDIRGTIYFNDLFAREQPSNGPYQAPRRRFFGRTCILKRRASEFRYVSGVERVERDPDPDQGQPEDQPEDQP
jgi:hypothetical protein